MGEFNSFLLHFRKIKQCRTINLRNIQLMWYYRILSLNSFGLKADRPTVSFLYLKILKLIASRPIFGIR